MNEEAGYEKLSALLREARPVAEMQPGFERQVWQRIEKADHRPANWLDWLARLVLTPRMAAGALAGIMILSASAGALQGFQAGHETARDRYLASVDPAFSRH